MFTKWISLLIDWEFGGGIMSVLTKETRLLDVKQASEMLRVHPSTLSRWSDQGLLPVYRLGPRKDRRFRLQDIATFIEYQDTKES